MKSHGNLYAYGTLGQSSNNVGSSNEPCRLKRAIEKLCTIHFQFGILICFAYSPRMRFMLSEHKLRITPVEIDAEINMPPMPSTEDEWREFLCSPEEAQANQKRIFRKALAQGKLVEHCEWRLVAYLLRHHSPPLVSYIGTSKLSCKPCFLWLQAANKVTDCQFHTKGCHDKWYPGWSTPALADSRFKSKIDKSFLRKVETELCEGPQASNIVRPRALSDSSNCSDGCKAVLDVEDMMGDRRMLIEYQSLFNG